MVFEVRNQTIAKTKFIFYPSSILLHAKIILNSSSHLSYKEVYINFCST